MKKLLFFYMCTFLSYQLLAQPFEKKQITDFNYDSRGAAFPTYPIGLAYMQYAPFFFEAHKDGSSNIMMMSYDSYKDSFFNPTLITSNNFLNINPIADASFNWNHKINLIWQTNENGNWDIALKTLSDTGWSSKSVIINSASDETNPTFILRQPFTTAVFEIEFLYEKENSIYLYQQNDSTVHHKLIFGGMNSIKYSQPTGIHHSPWPFTYAGLWIAATCQLNDSTSIIVYRYKPENDSLWSSVYTAYDSGYCNNPQFINARFTFPFLSFEKKLGEINQIFVLPEIEHLGQNEFAVRLIDDTSVSSSNLISFQYSLVTKFENFDIYSPFSFKIISHDSTYIVYTPQNYWINQWFYTKISGTRIGLGNLGEDYYLGAISYIVWEDSANGKINLFGVRRLDALGSVDDKISILNFTLFQNYPNPFNPKTVIQYNLLSRDYVSLKVFDVLGNEIAVLVNEEKEAGEFKIIFDGSNLASGIYIYRLAVGNKHFSRKMILLK